MPHAPLGAMDDPTAWSALAPGGGASAALAVEAGAETPPHLAGTPVCVVTGTAGAEGHRLERALPDVELDGFDELRIWLRSDRPATGGAASPLFLELRLAGGGVGFDDPANGWHRLLPVVKPGTWELVRLSVRDLPPAVRGAADAVRITCAAGGAAFHVALADPLAVREEWIGDVEQALVDALDGAVEVEGGPVAASLHHSAPGEPPEAPDAPALRLRQVAIRAAGGSVTYPPSRRDFTAAGFVLYDPPVGWELDYEAEVFTASRREKTRVMEFLLEELAPRGSVVVNGVALPVSWVPPPPPAPGEPWSAEEPRLRFRIATRREAAAGQPGTTPHREVSVAVEPLA